MYYEAETDETLVMLTLAGEQNAYEALVLRHQKAVLAAALSVTGRHFMAEDAAQDAFVTAWMKLNTLQETNKYGAWVCRIAKNCALNMMGRYRSFLPFETVENLPTQDAQTQDPAELFASSEKRSEVGRSVDRLPDRVREIVRLHYFEGLSIAEIADRMRISEGTVKSQLHDGRKRMRKDLCAMNETYQDTLVRRVMKKVEELKLWQIKRSKQGFYAVYRDVLRDVESLPESMDKQHALADVLLRGWWWLPGEKNDALVKRIADAAIEGKSEEAMEFIVSKEDSKWWGSAKIEFIRDKQIPRLEKAGFRQTLGREWFWLGFYYFREGDAEKGNQAYDKALELLTEKDVYYHMVHGARRLEAHISAECKERPLNRFCAGHDVLDFRYVNGALRYWNCSSVEHGGLEAADFETNAIFYYASHCDGSFFADIRPGESHVGTDGSVLTFVSDSETVVTLAGVFEGCCVWSIRCAGTLCGNFSKIYYKEGVGIVRFELTLAGITNTRSLSAFHIAGGSGLLPMAKGNRWEYVAEYPEDVMQTALTYEVVYADEQKVLLSEWFAATRLRFDENSWEDMVQQIAGEYHADKKVQDVSHAIERAEALAKTPLEKAHTKAAASVARRIMETDPTFNPKHTATGRWNFFNRKAFDRSRNALGGGYDARFEFEWKRIADWDEPLIFSDILGILQDAVNCVWSDEWRIGTKTEVEYMHYGNAVRTKIMCSDGGTVSTDAGDFENCLKLDLQIEGFRDGLAYRGGKKTYYFAEGIGVVRTENKCMKDTKTVIYELTFYEGTGSGYMPFEDGMTRRYEAIGLTDGLVGAEEYTCVADENGEIIIFTDRTGIRKSLPPISRYNMIQSEMEERQLADEGKTSEAQKKHAENNLQLLLHYLTRGALHCYVPDRSIAITQFNKDLLRTFGGGEEIPPAWVGLCGWFSLIQAAAFFGKGEKESGYACLEEAAECYERWNSMDGKELLPLGDRYVFGGMQYDKKGQRFVDADGEPKLTAQYSYRFDPAASQMHAVLTMKHGWEWFNSVRDEERFQAYIARAAKLLD